MMKICSIHICTKIIFSFIAYHCTRLTDLEISEIKSNGMARGGKELLQNKIKRLPKSCDDIKDELLNHVNGLHETQADSSIYVSFGNLDLVVDKACDKIDAYYKKIVSTEKVLGVVHRNTIVHGDYQDNDIDVSKDDCMKLMLLWVNMRLIADWLCNTNELYEILIGYLPGAIYNMVKDKN